MEGQWPSAAGPPNTRGMIADFAWIRPEPAGLYIRPADVWIDPSRAVPRAVITHGHADHARSGHGETMATPATLAIMRERYGDIGQASAMPYGERVSLGGGVYASMVPAGHVLGSAQILLEHAGERVVVTGDYKRRADPTCAPFVVTPCDVLITEATFGLPVFRHPPIGEEIAKLLAAREANPEGVVLVGAYALGKAQRVIAELRAAGYADPIWLHGAMERMCRVYAEFGVDLGDLRSVAGMPSAALKGAIAIVDSKSAKSADVRIRLSSRSQRPTPHAETRIPASGLEKPIQTVQCLFLADSGQVGYISTENLNVR